jgi:hypothetical protein
LQVEQTEYKHGIALESIQHAILTHPLEAALSVTPALQRVYDFARLRAKDAIPQVDGQIEVIGTVWIEGVAGEKRQWRGSIPPVAKELR